MAESPYRTWDCGCTSDNQRLFPCVAHSGPVGSAINLRADDPRLNVVYAPSLVTLTFYTAQGGLGRTTGVLSRDSLMQVMGLIGDLDEADCLACGLTKADACSRHSDHYPTSGGSGG